MQKASFGRKKDSRNLMLRSLATSVILYESIITTDTKGRTVQPIVDRLLKIGQQEDKVNARRQLLAYLVDPKAVDKILNELVSRFGARSSGFTRRFRLPNRLGDGAPQVMIQLTETVRLEEPSKNEPVKEKVTQKA